MSLEILEKHGVCCAVHISYPRLRDSLTLSMFGFELSEEGKSMLKAPSVRLFSEALKPVEQAERNIRALFVVNSLPLACGTGLRFCPTTGLANFCTKLNEGIDQFTQAAEIFVETYEESLADVRRTWAVTLQDQEQITEERRTKILEHVLSVLPENAPHISQFSASVNWWSLGMPGKPSMQDMEATEAAAAAEAYEAVRAKAAQDASHMADSFVGTCRRELIERMRQFFNSLATTVQSGKSVNVRTVRRVTAFVDQMSQLNFMKDADIDRIMTSFRTTCLAENGNTITSSRNIDAVRGTIDAVVTALAAVDDNTYRLDGVLSNVLRSPSETSSNQDEEDDTESWRPLL